MPTARIRNRCPSARSLGVAQLRGYALRWHKKSTDGSGKCDIVRSGEPSASVFGVLYKVASNDKAKLDKAEGLGSGYDETEIEVYRGAVQLKAKAYVATATDPALKPYSWYRALVVFGAKEHGLPASYVAQLEAVPVDEDPDRVRHDMNMRLIEKTQV
jgi:AIG2 family protein